jgi:hypothetical protein
MNRNEITPAIELAIREDKRDHPYWPDHAAGQAGRVCAASGKLMTECMDYKYKGDLEAEIHLERMQEAAIYTIAMAYRFLENLKLPNSNIVQPELLK